MSDTPASTPTPVGPMTPLFMVSDLRRSARFYTDVLGFNALSWIGEPDEDPYFVVLARGTAQLFLKSSDEGTPPVPNHLRDELVRWDAFVQVDEVDALAAELSGRGCGNDPARDWDDGVRGFEVQDVDGFVLFFGHALS